MPGSSDDLGLQGSGHPPASIKQQAQHTAPPGLNAFSFKDLNFPGHTSQWQSGEFRQRRGKQMLLCLPNPAMPSEAGPGPHAHPYQDTAVQTYYITYTELCNALVLINKQRLPQVTSKNNLRN